MPKEVKVSLGGRSYTVAALPILKSKAWREEFAKLFGELSAALTSASVNNIELDQLSDIAALVRQMSGVLIGSVDTMLDLMFAYSPILAADREWIEENAYDEEALRAFTEVLKLAFPFGILLEMVIGPTATKTSPNSLSRNGASPLPASGPKRSKTSSQTPT